MKKLIVWLCAAALICASCASSGTGAAGDSGAGAPAAGSTRGAQAAKNAQTAVETKEKVLFADGSLDEYTVSEYDDSLTQLKAQKRFSASDALLEQVEFAYDGNRLASRTTKDAEGRLKNQMVYAYNAQGLVSKETLMNKAGKEVSSTEYSYDAKGGRVKTVVSSGALMKMAEIANTLDNRGRVTLSETRNGSGQAVSSVQNAYDGGGNLTEQKIINARGELNAVTKYVWKNGLEVSSEQSGADGSVRLRVTSEYGDAGELLKQKIENFQGNFVQLFEYEYSFKPARR